MTISKKITLGALILLAGVLFLPMKTWAADPMVTVTVDKTSTNGTITYSVSEFPTGTSDKYSLELSGNIKSGAQTSFSIIDDGTDFPLSSNAIDYLGLSDVASTTSYNLTGKLMKNTSEEVSGGVAMNGNTGDVYVGKVSTTADHLYLGSGFSTQLKGNDKVFRTINPNEQYNVTVSAKAPYYITVYDKKRITVESKVSAGDVTLKEDKVSVSLTKPTITSAGTYTTDVASVTPADYPLASVYCKPDNAQLGSGTGDINVGTISFNPETKRFSWTVTGYGNYSNASFDLYIGETTADEKVGTIKYDINISSMVPKGISITPGNEYVLASTGTAYTYTATLAGYTSVPTILWTLNGDVPAGCTISGTGTTGTLTVGSTTGTLTIKAADDAEPSVNGTKTVKVVTIDKPTTPAGADSIVYSSRTPVSYTSSVKYNNGDAVLKEHDSVTWALYETSDSTSGATKLIDGSDKTIAQVNATSGEVTLGDGATKDTKIYLRATSKADSTKISDPKKITITDIIPVTGIDFVTKAVTKNFVLDMSVNKNVKISPSTAVDSIDYITWSSSDTDKGEITSTYTYKGHNAGFKGLKEGITTLTPTIYYVNGTYETLSGTSFKVYNPVTVENFDSNDGLKFTLPDAVYRSYSDDKNISEVTGYRIDVLNKDGNSVYNSTTSTNSKSITLSGDTVENLIENATGNLSGDTHQVKLMISPVGKSQTNSGSTVTNSEENVRGISDTRTAYKVSVSGSNIKSASIYGLANHSVKITATPTSSTYKFAGWSDGNTSNPRTVTVSTNTSSNSYTATANTTGTPTSNAGNSSGGSKGSNSKLDKVPKTGESMAIYFIVMIAVISGCVAFATLFKSLTAKAAKSGYEGSIDSWRGGEDGTGESHKK